MRLKKLKISEKDLLKQVTDYLKIAYPNIIYRVDYGAGLKMNIAQAVYQKRVQKCRAFPDIFIAHTANCFSGLFLELKTDPDQVLTKKGFNKSRHIKEQADILNELSQAGYKAVFACGFDAAKNIIDNYLKH